MLNRTAVIVLSSLMILFATSSCKKAIELPEGVEVLIDGETIEGNKEVLVDQGAEVRLQVTGLKGNSIVNFQVKKVGIKLYEEAIGVEAEGSVDKMIALPDIQASATAVINYVDLNNESHEMSFVIKLR